MKIDKFWTLKWILLTLIGFLISLFFIEVGERSELTIAEGVIGGAMISIPQSILFVNYSLSLACSWVLGNMLSWGLMATSGIGVIGWVAPETNQLLSRFQTGCLFGLICGGCLGLAQWLILRKQVSKAWRWLLISPLYWSMALAIGWTIGGILRSQTNFFLGEVIGLGITWILVATTTGLTLQQFFKTSLRPLWLKN